ncbi:Major Facilitator Superfamily protein [Aspergillus parasiticus SU-1]|uniref:Major Facilitator Superfamily protein n=1 Tax=Aspergillus parasiticus (strain ATCC 56775 / NRRL 5862 / SRRC 143 / SU-1) TaxID=1403190 RepID=A0A0F0IHH9_ASPPU|nr:Major Facilitator Superfamily protein [Aspergillus parasiticus SU-1]
MAPASSPPTQPTLNIDQSLEGTPSFDGVEETEVSVPMTQTVAIITSITFIVADLHIPPALQLWPTAAFPLACGCMLLPCGAAADVLGCRRACLFGGLLQTASALGAELSATGTQLIVRRVIVGLAASFCLPSDVGATAHVFPANSSPRRRSIAFAAMGGGQAVGFELGLALGGVFSDTIGWRWGFYVTAILNSAVLALALWAIPKSADGVLLISTCVALFSYELAVATGSDADRSMRQPLSLILLCSPLALILIFVLWMRRQARLSRPALVLNSLWTNVPFTVVCITVFLVWGTLNASEQLTALYLQDVRGTSTLTASLYFMVAPVCGLLMNAAIGISLPYLKPSIAVPTGCLVSGIAPLLLATLCGVDGPGFLAWRIPSHGSESAGRRSNLYDRKPSDDRLISSQDAGASWWCL